MQYASLRESPAHCSPNAAVRREQAGADFLVIGTNTVHIVGDRIARAIHIAILHAADPTAAGRGGGVGEVDRPDGKVFPPGVGILSAVNSCRC